MDDRRARAHVEEERHPDAVEEIPGVARRRPPHVEERQARHDGRDARERLDRAERIAEGARDLPDLLARERGGARRLAAIAGDGDLGDVVRGPRSSSVGPRRRRGRRGLGLGRGLHDDRRAEDHLDPDARRDRDPAARRRLVPPPAGGAGGLGRERLRSGGVGDGGRDGALFVDGEREEDRRVARSAGGVLDGRVREQPRGHDLRRSGGGRRRRRRGRLRGRARAPRERTRDDPPSAAPHRREFSTWSGRLASAQRLFPTANAPLPGDAPRDAAAELYKSARIGEKPSPA